MYIDRFKDVPKPFNEVFANEAEDDMSAKCCGGGCGKPSGGCCCTKPEKENGCGSSITWIIVLAVLFGGLGGGRQGGCGR